MGIGVRGIGGHGHHNGGIHVLPGQAVGKPAAVNLHGGFFVTEELAAHFLRDSACLVAEGADLVEMADQLHPLIPGIRHLFQRCGPGSIIFRCATYQNAHLRQIMRDVRQRYRNRNDPFRVEAVNCCFKLLPRVRQCQAISFEQIDVNKQRLPEGAYRNGVHPPVSFGDGRIDRQIQFRVGGIYLINRYHTTQDGS